MYTLLCNCHEPDYVYEQMVQYMDAQRAKVEATAAAVKADWRGYFAAQENKSAIVM
jgi:hypothetical protein